MSATAVQLQAEKPKPVAPYWHTGILLAIVFGLSFWSAYRHNFGVGGFRGVPRYLWTIGWQWAVVAFLGWGTRKRGVRLRDLVGPLWSFAKCLEDFAVAVGFLFVSYITLTVASHLLQPETNAAIISILPQSRAEVAAYLAMAISAGITEELIFRGYLMRQITALFGNLPVAIVLQGAIFGASHGYQGWKRMIILSIFGILFGLLADWRRSLRPGMIGHGLSDALVGVLWFARH